MALFVLGNNVQGQSGTLTGTVRRDSTSVVAGALVTLDPGPRARTTRSSFSGYFAFSQVAPGPHIIRVIAIGFTETSIRVETTTADTSIVVGLRQLPQVIDSVVVTATRTGLYGFVGNRKDLSPLRSANVQVIGARTSAVTDSNGAFSLPNVAPGRNYVVRITREGYAPRSLPITIPPQRGYQLGVFLDSATAPVSTNLDGVLRDFDSRVKEGGFWSVLIPRQELGTNARANVFTEMARAPSLLQKDLHFHPAALGNPSDPSYPCIWVDGYMMTHGWSLDALSADEILAIEVYGFNSPQDRRLKYTRGDVRPVDGRPPCGQFRRDASPADEGPRPRGMPTVRVANPRQMIGSIVVWLRH
jgi:hypothetical protein